MKISASVKNSENSNKIILNTNGVEHELEIAPKVGGFGSSANGGELLFLALATCYCNDIYREAVKLGITVHSVEINVDGEFGAAGDPAKDIRYFARVKAKASNEQIEALMKHTDKVAEIQNTLRQGIAVQLVGVETIVSS